MYKLVTTPEDLDSTKPVFCDLETIGLYGTIRLISMYQPDKEVQIIEWPNPMALIALLSPLTSVWHNAHYDITTIAQQSGTSWCPNNFHDTFLLARLHYPDKDKFSLDHAMSYALGYDPYLKQGLDKKALQKSNWKATLTPEQFTYAATDVYYMSPLYDEVVSAITDQNYLLDIATIKTCAKFQWNGMYVDQDRLQDKYEKNDLRIKELAVPINVNSWQQVRRYLDTDESDDLALARLSAQGNQKAADVREARKLKKQQNFINKFDTPDNRIYGKFKPSARSGRLTSNDQNLQQIPRALKGLFGADVGNVLVFSDYAQLELRTIAAITGCDRMIELMRDDVDIHGYTAEFIFRKDYSSEERRIAKTYNFNLLYGGGNAMISTLLLKNVGIVQDEQTINKAKNKWRSLWREIYQWQQVGIQAWHKGRLGATPMGRKYKAERITDQLNIQNQGAGAEVASLALTNLVLPDGALLVNFIHDSYIVECPYDMHKEVANILGHTMQDAWLEASKNFKVKDLPMPVDVLVGTNWGDIEQGHTIYDLHL